ncbi:hypothetical protein OQH61_08090 [Helicobacter sp. MIT 21-1697]|uniref:hypothetical protein n=1 Tax=Helicobacter sp. MIT 21-1697 TaxID=2993733 RepID=UPI00224AB452|nr:hypothetical protein [Helicobacter sp. MIT 21-1697]MCX2717693.1 hypothetical protein [Helicobacter sp. MIT 21-1697]
MTQKIYTFFDSQTHISYAFENNTITPCKKCPKKYDILSFSATHLIHLAIEIDKSALASPQLSSLLFGYAYEKSVLNAPVDTYKLYFIPRAHLFDEQKCVCESFFFDRNALKGLPPSRVFTCDIFLPFGFSSLEPCTNNFLVWTQSYLCYFENAALKEICPLKSTIQSALPISFANPAEDSYSMLDSHNNVQLFVEITSHISYLQEAHNKHFECIYTTAPLKDLPNDMPYSILPLSELSPHTQKLDYDALKAILAFEYIAIYDNLLSQGLSHTLPHFILKPNIRKKLYYVLAILFGIFMLFIPLLLALHNRHLESAIAQLNAQSEALFTPKEIPQEHIQTAHTLEQLLAQQNAFITDMNTLSLWQQTYNQRYAFVRDIFAQCDKEHITLENIEFTFSPQVFIASLTASSPSQIHLSALLAQLNTQSQQHAFLHISSPSNLDSQTTQNEQELTSAHFYSHILVIYYAI